MDEQCTVTFDLSLEMMPMRRSVQAGDNCARDNRERQGKGKHAQLNQCATAASGLCFDTHQSRHGLWSDSPQVDAWNTVISLDQLRLLRAFQMLTRCEATAMLHEKQSDKLVSL